MDKAGVFHGIPRIDDAPLAELFAGRSWRCSSEIGDTTLAVIPELDIVFVHRFDSDNSIPHYESLPVFKLLDLLIAAKEDEIINKSRFVSLKSIPFPQISKTILKPDKIKLADEVLSSYEGNYYLPPVNIKIKKDGDHLQHIEADGSVFDNLYPESENKINCINSHSTLR